MDMIMADDFEEIEEEVDDEAEEAWHLAAAMVVAGHGRNHCCAEPCRNAPYTENALVQEFLKSVESLQRCSGRRRAERRVPAS
jgi:hypothetical protein